MLDAGNFFNIFGSIKRFRWLREIFHQTLVAVWVVYLSYLPLWSSAVPPLPLAPVPPLSLYSVLVFFFPLSLGSQPKLTFCSSLYWSCPVSLLCIVFCRVLRDSTPRFVGPSVGPSHFTFLALLGVLALLLLPKCSTDLNYGPCPPARDWGSRVSGLVLSASSHFYKSSCLSVGWSINRLDAIAQNVQF